MIKLHAEAEDVVVRVLFALLVAQLVVASENDVGLLHDPGFVCGKPLRRAGNLRELIYAVVDDAEVLEVAEALFIGLQYQSRG